ncbi:MAG: acyltransferase [Proteobacteria bacterium]|nr:acyltransferase [Pseudomonadota bacterium]
MPDAGKDAWLHRPEGGGWLALWLIRTIALTVGRLPARLVLIPVTLYFLWRRGPERRASRRFLTRALGRPATLLDVARHVYTFAVVTLDRVFLLSDAFRGFDIRTFGLEELHQALDLQHGALLIGAHVGSFDALRVLALQRPEQSVRPVIDLEQNPTVSRLLAALNPAIAASIINARQDGTSTALAIHEALQQRALVTLLADRARPGNTTVEVDFLGARAAFPTAPWLLAATLKVPVVLCFGLYRGGRRYDLHFEAFSSSLEMPRKGREAAVHAVVQRFATRLAHYVRLAPLNWFNFYDLWV